ncbi:sulfate ABC transporter substrate-binding protein [Nocardioides piscis]|uniref:Sulfate ABC transporter substrate-binding protein n=1 Tax=Nocardioides piscis TaxID=2714938 RepID=A0A6G7YCL6_9ACTN|nr:sulfate ABC transporter substrate-binding protein [Nocardioides piscis]QIK74469.1 sulfate ABC transporter substrate-binding protein [Nocardioides piscis]
MFNPRSGSRPLVAASLTGLLALTACSTASEGASEGTGTSIDLVAYSTPETAYDEITENFSTTDEGEGVEFSTSYGPSGDQSRAVEGGQPADYVNFSLESDVTRLVDAGIVADDWQGGEHEGIVADSVVVIVTRPGNPLGINGWEDIVEPGVEIVSPNPGSSGGARWNLLAAYGHALAVNDGDEKAARDYLVDFFTNAVALPGSARDALTSFTSGVGDVLISYENEAILARQNGEEIDYVVPDETLLIETPGAVTQDAEPAAQAFLDYLYTEEAQASFLKYGYRPVVDGVTGEVEGANDPADPFPTPKTLFTVADDFGGWPAASEKFFADGEDGEPLGLVAEVQQETGKLGE